MNAFRKCKSRRKWLRAHRNFEWPDAYSNENIEDLEKFYARYLKLERNGWELTPKSGSKYRMSESSITRQTVRKILSR